MPQIFPSNFNSVARFSLLGIPLSLAALLWAGIVYTGSSYGTRAGNVVSQPVPFSHQHHVGDLGIDCRYCHTSVEHAPRAGMPSTHTCMNCHSQMWVGSDMLKPVRDSYHNNKPIVWNRVHNLPGFVYFDHSIHVQKGVGCTECHGRVDEMPLTYQDAPLTMQWCLKCHRQPEQHLRPVEEVFNMHWETPANQSELGKKLVELYQIKDTKTLTSCTVCHR